MSDRQRLRRLAESVAAEGCPECGAGGKIVLLPMNLEDGPQPEPPEPTPCPLCGAMPIRLRPMRLDGDVQLSDDESEECP